MVLDEVGRPRPKLDSDYEGGMAVCVGNVHTNDGFFDVTLSLCVNNVVRGAWGAALAEPGAVRPPRAAAGRARIAAKQNAPGHGARRRARASAFLQEKGAQEAVAALGRVIEVGVEHRLRVVARHAVGLGDPPFGVGPWEDESPTCIDTAIKRPPAPPYGAVSSLSHFVNCQLRQGEGHAPGHDYAAG